MPGIEPRSQQSIPQRVAIPTTLRRFVCEETLFLSDTKFQKAMDAKYNLRLYSCNPPSYQIGHTTHKIEEPVK
jgi:hypothetical protein